MMRPLTLPIRDALRLSLVVVPPRSPADTELLRHALARQMYGDPKLANEAVTGACIWDGNATFDQIDALAMSAADQAYDLEQAREMGIPISQHRIDRLRAAEQAFVWLAKDKEEEICRADELAEERGGRRIVIGRSF